MRKSANNDGLRLRVWQFVSLSIVVSLAGCGDDRGLIPVSGRISLGGGEMPGKGYLRFVPLEVESGYTRRAGIAKFETDGNYRVRSFKPGDGLFPGKYAVFPYCWEVEPNMDGKPAKSYLPDRYVDPQDPPFSLQIKSGDGAMVFDIDIKQ